MSGSWMRGPARLHRAASVWQRRASLRAPRHGVGQSRMLRYASWWRSSVCFHVSAARLERPRRAARSERQRSMPGVPGSDTRLHGNVAPADQGSLLPTIYATQIGWPCDFDLRDAQADLGSDALRELLRVFPTGLAAAQHNDLGRFELRRPSTRHRIGCPTSAYPVALMPARVSVSSAASRHSWAPPNSWSTSSANACSGEDATTGTTIIASIVASVPRSRTSAHNAGSCSPSFPITSTRRGASAGGFDSPSMVSPRRPSSSRTKPRRPQSAVMNTSLRAAN